MIKKIKKSKIPTFITATGGLSCYLFGISFGWFAITEYRYSLIIPAVLFFVVGSFLLSEFMSILEERKNQ